MRHKIGLNHCLKSTTNRAAQCLYPLKWLRYDYGSIWLKQISERKRKKRKIQKETVAVRQRWGAIKDPRNEVASVRRIKGFNPR